LNRPGTEALTRLADGTLVLIAFTMLISLSQDLKEAVRPNARQLVERLELLLRTTALIMIGVFTFYQALAVNRPVKDGDTTRFWLEVWLSVGAFVLLLFSTYACHLSLKILRPHFNDKL